MCKKSYRMNFKAFETDRLIIRPTNVSDAPFILELMNTPKWLQFIGDRKLKTIHDAANYISSKMLPQLKELGYSNNTVIRKFDNVKIGCCGLYNRIGLDGIDIGFAFLPNFEGKSYAYEASNKIKDAALNEFNIQTLKAITSKENVGSQRLLEKLGLTFTKMITIPNDPEALILYELQ